MTNINEDQNNISKELLPLIEYAKWELHNFNLLKKTTKVIKKELIIIDKDFIKLWKEKSGYNFFKKQIFNYLYNMNKIKNQNEKKNEENNKLNTMWKKAISDKKINLSNINSLPKKDMGIFYTNLNEKQIDGYKNYEIISAKLYEYFKDFINYKITIDGFYNKGKLIIPLNKNNINNNIKEKNEFFLEIIYINNKNDSEDILYILPNDIDICNKIEKDLIDDTIDNLIKNIFSKINEQENKKDFYYSIDDGNQIVYKVLNKKLLINQKYHIKESNIEKKEKSQKYKVKKNNNNIMILNNINNNSTNIEKEIDKLKLELLKKMKNFENLKLSISERNNNLTKKKNDLEKERIKFNEEKNKYYKEQQINDINEKNEDNYYTNNINEQKKKIEDLKNKCLMNEKEYEEKQKELSILKKKILDKEKFLNSYINKNNNIIKSKEKEFNQKNMLLNNDENEYEKRRMTIGTDSNNCLIKEDNLKNKEKILNEKDNELILREKELNERKNKINEDKLELIQNENELDVKLKELDEKILFMKNKEYLMNVKKDEDEENDNMNEEIDDKELAKIQEELEEEMMLDNNNKKEINKNKKNNSIIKKIDIQQKLGNSFEENRRFLSPNNTNVNNLHFTDKKKPNRRFTINPQSDNSIQTNIKDNKHINISNNLLRAKTISLANSYNYKLNNFSSNNINSKLSLNTSFSQTQTKINRSLPSLGLEKVDGPINLIAILQCFAHIPELAEGVLELGYKKFFKERKNIKLSRNFATIVNNIFFPIKFNNTSRKYSPEIFVQTFLNLYPQENPTNYINTLKIVKFMIETFHDELNIKKNNTEDDEDSVLDNEEEEKNEKENNFDNSNEKDVIVKFLTKLTENNNSLISKLFFGLIKYKCVCNNCGNMIYAFDYYSYLFFDLLKIRQYKSNNKFGNNNSNFLSLNDCLDYFCRPINISNSLKGIQKTFYEKFNVNKENGKIFCKKCQEEKFNTLYKSIYSACTILPIILERGNDDNYYINELKFPDELNLENYVEFNKSIKKYYLCGVVSNLGRNNTLGQFCAYCRMVPNGAWYCYKNEKVNYCSPEDVHQKGVPYMLFYHKI